VQYISTRGDAEPVDASRAIIQGIASDGGLYLPSEIPSFTKAELDRLPGMDYTAVAKMVLQKYLTDYTEAELDSCLAGAYSSGAFPDEPVRITETASGRIFLELWHGPTAAFKDMALQLMPRLFVTGLRKNKISSQALVLTATSGDTGKAALEGFRDVPGTHVAVFYPEDGVSAVQQRQMTSQEGSNVHVAAVRGNFDDAQSAVKEIFADTEFAAKLRASRLFLTSANSINWGRLVPQIVYYVYTCARLRQRGTVEAKGTVDVCVPTGNFGNILAAYLAKRMGAPIGKLFCASNANNVLADFLLTGVYDRNRPFYRTTSPSMDILISSNLERLLFLLSGCDSAYISSLMQALRETGRYEVKPEMRAQLLLLFSSGFRNDAQSAAEIKKIWQEDAYLIDPHTAVAAAVVEHRMKLRTRGSAMIVVSTASPYKFAGDVLEALTGEETSDPFAALDRLADFTGVPVPSSLSGIQRRMELHTDVLDRQDMRSWLLGRMGIPGQP